VSLPPLFSEGVMSTIQFDEDQKRAVEYATNEKNRVVAITGPSGSGKTTIMRAIYDWAFERGLDPVAMAPTGKASRRINEATGIDAMTIHRGLEFPHPGERDTVTGKPINHTYPRRTRGNPLPNKVFLVDEYATVNSFLHRCIVEAIPPGGLIRMFGDANQLRPIEEDKALRGKPSKFEMFIDSPRFKSVRLTHFHRTGKGASAVTNGQRILDGQVPKEFDDYRIKYTSQPVVEISNLMNVNPEVWATTDAQAITPTRISWIGTEKVNASLQHNVFRQVFASTEKYMLVERHRWVKNPLVLYIGDKIIITSNNYDLGLFNGDIGKVLDLDTTTETIIADFYGKTYVIASTQQANFGGTLRNFNPQKDIELAYVITTHKTQGSEWKKTAYVINQSCSFMCNRRNMYTGTTRHKEEIDVICDSRSMSQSLWKKGD
jgi:exodeoxyribonuclease V alpha subunit